MIVTDRHLTKLLVDQNQNTHQPCFWCATNLTVFAEGPKPSIICLQVICDSKKSSVSSPEVDPPLSLLPFPFPRDCARGATTSSRRRPPDDGFRCIIWNRRELPEVILKDNLESKDVQWDRLTIHSGKPHSRKSVGTAKKEETFCNFEGGEGSQCCQLWENYEENVESVLFLLKHLMVIFLSIGTDTLSVFGLLDLVPKDGAVLKSAIITFRSIWTWM